MIAKLAGRLDSYGEDYAVIDVGGVGYLVSCSTRTLRGLPDIGDAVAVLTETHMREDHIQLFGFRDSEERRWFRLLQNVQGVGARMALSILSVFEPDALAAAIVAQDQAALVRANGVGPKLARRILGELKDKVATPVTEMSASPSVDAGGMSEEAISALINLGYGRSEAFTAVNAAARGLGPSVGVTDLIRAGLKELAP